MKLHFLGRGNSSNAKEGNTAAYFIEGKHLFLIDCGETVFNKLLLLNILDNIQEIHIMITHTHSDHIGSLSSLLMYCYYNQKKKVHIILPRKALHKNNIITLLECTGCTKEMYDIKEEGEYDDQFHSFRKIHYLETNHVDYLACYGISFETDDGILYYSGDSKEMNNILELLISKKMIDKLYVDVTCSTASDSIHLSIQTLYNNIPENIRNKVYCMHFNNHECIKKAIEYGFHVVEVE